jgi:membrane protein
VLVLWVYYATQILFFGAEFTQAYARQRGARIEPTANAVSKDDRQEKPEQQERGRARPHKPATIS